MIDILAIDIGTHCGYAYNRGDSATTAGTLHLATKDEVTAWGKERITRRKDPRVERLCDFLTNLGTFDVIIFEDVEFMKYRLQTQLWSSLRAAIWLCGTARVFECLPVGTLKKFATGSGKASKELMAKFLAGDAKLDDNAVDAIWLWRWAELNLKRIC